MLEAPNSSGSFLLFLFFDIKFVQTYLKKKLQEISRFVRCLEVQCGENPNTVSCAERVRQIGEVGVGDRHRSFSEIYVVRSTARSTALSRHSRDGVTVSWVRRRSIWNSAATSGLLDFVSGFCVS
jgi:hypothetical protein